jgi:misacylated tRNA(Ala) deacylase
VDWERRFGLMRAHTALHLVNGLIWLDAGARVSGASMDPAGGRADFALDSISQSFGRELEARVNEQIDRSLTVTARLVPRVEADHDPSLLRSHANLIPREIDPLRIIDIADLDRQACSGTHVRDTAEIGAIRVVGTKSKGRANKRVTIALA